MMWHSLIGCTEKLDNGLSTYKSVKHTILNNYELTNQPSYIQKYTNYSFPYSIIWSWSTYLIYLPTLTKDFAYLSAWSIFQQNQADKDPKPEQETTTKQAKDQASTASKESWCKASDCSQGPKQIPFQKLSPLHSRMVRKMTKRQTKHCWPWNWHRSEMQWPLNRIRSLLREKVPPIRTSMLKSLLIESQKSDCYRRDWWRCMRCLVERQVIVRRELLWKLWVWWPWECFSSFELPAYLSYRYPVCIRTNNIILPRKIKHYNKSFG